MSFDEAVAAIGQQLDDYARRLGAWTDEDFTKEVDVFGRKSSKGLLVITQVLNGHAAYRTQLFFVPEVLRARRAGHDESVVRCGHAGDSINVAHVNGEGGTTGGCLPVIRRTI